MNAWRRPRSLEEALALREAHPDWTLLAGGTDLMVGALDAPRPVGVIDLFGLPELRALEIAEDGGLTLGAGLTYADLLANEDLARRVPLLHEAAREIGALQIQARGTLGGNLGTSSPVGDTLPCWLALDAEIEVASPEGRRRIAYAAFCTGYRETQLRPDELIVAVHVPPLPSGSRQFWRKVGARRAQAISKVMIAVVLRVQEGVIDHCRIGLGAVADRPVRARDTEARVMGRAPDAATAELARVAVAAEINPIDDLRSTADYRRTVTANLVARALLDLGAPTMMKLLPFVLLALVTGAAVALQGATNAALKGRIGLGAALVVNTTPILLAVLLLAWADGSWRQLSSLGEVPRPWLLGGLYGLVIIAGAAVVFPRLGATTTLTLFVAAQLAAALALDHLGALGLPKVEVSPDAPPGPRPRGRRCPPGATLT